MPCDLAISCLNATQFIEENKEIDVFEQVGSAASKKQASDIINLDAMSREPSVLEAKMQNDRPAHTEVSPEDLKELATTYGMPTGEIQTIKRLFDKFDINQNGTLDRKEFQLLMSNLLDCRFDEIPTNVLKKKM